MACAKSSFSNKLIPCWSGLRATDEREAFSDCFVFSEPLAKFLPQSCNVLPPLNVFMALLLAEAIEASFERLPTLIERAVKDEGERLEGEQIILELPVVLVDP